MLWSESLVLEFFFPKLILCKLWHVWVKRTSFRFFHLVPFWWPNTRVSDRHEDPQLYEINLLSIVGHKQSSSKRDGLLISLPHKENYLCPHRWEKQRKKQVLYNFTQISNQPDQYHEGYKHAFIPSCRKQKNFKMALKHLHGKKTSPLNKQANNHLASYKEFPWKLAF